MQYTALFPMAALLWFTGAVPPSRVETRGHRPAMLTNLAADQLRAAGDLAGLRIVDRFDAYGTDAARQALGAAENVSLVIRVDNGTNARIVDAGRDSRLAWIRVELLDGPNRGRVVYVSESVVRR